MAATWNGLNIVDAVVYGGGDGQAAAKRPYKVRLLKGHTWVGRIKSAAVARRNPLSYAAMPFELPNVRQVPPAPTETVR